MCTGWKSEKWGDLVTLEYGKGLRGYEYASGIFPVFGTNGLIGRHSEPLCPHPGVIVGRKGAYRGIHYSESPFYVIDTAFYVKPKTALNLKWVYYTLLTYDINSMDSGSAIPSTSRDEFYNLPVKVPPLAIQDRVASILSSLDDKIELNRKMNETLETTARAIFKSWFIDFDPVRAKMEGRKPEGMDDETAELFPNAFEDSELGKSPKGWRAGTLDDVISNPRQSAKVGDFGSDTNYIALDHMPQQSVALTSWETGATIASNKFRFGRGDILFGKLRPYFHKVGMAPVDGVCSTDILVLTAKEPYLETFSLLHLSTRELIDFAISHSDGTRMPRTSWQDLARYCICIPPQSVLTKFERYHGSSMKHIVHNVHENRFLTTIRDSLLRRLLSGVTMDVQRETVLQEGRWHR